jgi:hypothetical protein
VSSLESYSGPAILQKLLKVSKKTKENKKGEGGFR